MPDPWTQLFVGRNDLLSRLARVWDVARAGQPQLVVLLGESGLGKTRLAQEFYGWLQAHHDPAQEQNPHGYWPDGFRNAGQNLDVNPTFPSGWQRGRIPWLWWGLRWTTPDARNRPGDASTDESRCALLDHLPTLHGHLAPILLRQQRKGLLTDAAWTAGNLVASIVTPLQIVFALRDAGKLLRSHTQEREIARQIDAEVAAARDDHTQSLADATLAAFSTILQRGPDHDEPLPVILLLDDAQWIDPVTLSFVWRLFARALSNRWPLMVLATHWEQEWRTDQLAPPSAPPRRLADLPRLPEFADAMRSWSPILVDPVPDLTDVIRAALPGLTAAQVGLLSDKAGGNPQLLEEILRWVIDDERHFLDEQRTAALTRETEEEIRSARFDRHELFARRFARLDREVRRALGWSSVQGQRFITDITFAAARAVDPKASRQAIEAALRQGESPHALIRLHPGRPNLGEFRQNAFREVALTYLHGSRKELAAVEEAVRRTLIEWIETGRIDTLLPEERADALEMARRHLRPGESDDDRVFARFGAALVRLLRHYRQHLLWDQAWRVADEIAALRPEGWPIGLMPIDDQLDFIAALCDGAQIDSARVMALNLRKQVFDAPETPWRHSFAVEWWCGYAHFEGLDLSGARTFFESALSIWDQNASGDRTAQDWSHLGWCLVRLGHIAQDCGELDGSERCYQRLEQVVPEMQSRGVPEPRVLRLRSLSYSGRAIVAELRRDFETAAGLYRRAIELASELAQLDPENWEIVRSIAIDSNRLAQVCARLGRADEAGMLVDRSIALRRRLLEARGATPDAVADVAFGLADGAFVLSTTPRHAETRDMLLDAAESLNRLDVAGTLKPVHARYLGVILRTLGDMSGGANAPTSAKPLYEHALRHLLRAAQAAGDSVIDKQNLASIAERLAECELALGNGRAAIAGYLQAATLYQQAYAAVGSAGALRALAVALLSAGRTLAAVGQGDAAAPLLTDAAAAFRRIIQHAGGEQFDRDRLSETESLLSRLREGAR